MAVMCLPWKCCLTHARTHTHTKHTHTSTPITPILSLELTGWVMLTGTPLESVCVWGGRRKSKERDGGKKWRRRKVMEGWKLGEFRGGRRKRKRENRLWGEGEPHHAARGRMKHVSLSSATHCKWMAPAILPSATYLCGPKVDKRVGEKEGRRLENGEEEFLLPQTRRNLLQFLKTNMTGWNYSATTKIVICKCHKVQV